MIWSIFGDVMPIAMLTWGATGPIMWWQIKRTRLIGAAVIALSLTTAGVMHVSMLHFDASTKLECWNSAGPQPDTRRINR